MGARAFELTDVTDEAGLLSTGYVAVDSPSFTIAKRIAYSVLRKPIRASELLKTGAYTLATGDHANILIFTTAATLTVPIAAALAAAFRAQVYADGVAVTVTRSGGGSFTLASGELVTIMVANGKVLYFKQPGLTIL